MIGYLVGGWSRAYGMRTGLLQLIRLNVKSIKANPPARQEPRQPETTADRRRIGRIVRDERGRSTLEWVEVQDDTGRDALTLLDAPLSVEKEVDSFNPYDRRPVTKAPDAKPVKRDLRKLSEWIKTMRAVEEKKARGEDDE